jgi:hypothetical protein
MHFSILWHIIYFFNTMPESLLTPTSRLGSELCDYYSPPLLVNVSSVKLIHSLVLTHANFNNIHGVGSAAVPRDVEVGESRYCPFFLAHFPFSFLRFVLVRFKLISLSVSCQFPILTLNSALSIIIRLDGISRRF